jgi:hypothetical protein
LSATDAGNVMSRKPFAESGSAFLNQMLDLKVCSVFTLGRSDAPSSHVCGQIIEVNGGQLMP